MLKSSFETRILSRLFFMAIYLPDTEEQCQTINIRLHLLPRATFEDPGITFVRSIVLV